MKRARRPSLPRVVRDTESIGRALVARYQDDPGEFLHVLCLDASKRILRDSVVPYWIGAPRMVAERAVRIAFEANACILLVYHRAPEASPEPSPEDLLLTRVINRTTALLDYDFEDHIIIGAGRFVSLRQRGAIRP